MRRVDWRKKHLPRRRLWSSPPRGLGSLIPQILLWTHDEAPPKKSSKKRASKKKSTVVVDDSLEEEENFPAAATWKKYPKDKQLEYCSNFTINGKCILKKHKEDQVVALLEEDQFGAKYKGDGKYPMNHEEKVDSSPQA